MSISTCILNFIAWNLFKCILICLCPTCSKVHFRISGATNCIINATLISITSFIARQERIMKRPQRRKLLLKVTFINMRGYLPGLSRFNITVLIKRHSKMQKL